ncbi:MAG: M15 family metallopeptidase [Clostridia bacterium]|nr:M15 family metallopeptidase [Clostridia bacterium]
MRNRWILGALMLIIAAIALFTAIYARKAPVSLSDDGPAEDFSVTAAPIVTLEPALYPPATPEPVLQFAEDAAYPLPSLENALPLGSSARLRGVVSADRPLAAVRISISCSHHDDPFYPYILIVNMPEGEEIYSYALDSDATAEGWSLDAMTRFADLQVGLHTMRISAMVEGGDRFIEVTRARFNVLDDEWLTILPSDFNGSYEAALRFFQDDARFLYRYQWVYGRYTIADPAWESAYITEIEAYPDGQKWKIHIDALPFYQRALAYLGSAHVRVHGANGDTGVLPLSALIVTYEGSYVSRFTSSKKTISHHAFGTATDLNAQMEPNLNKPENSAVVDDEVLGCLSYNGILEENGQKYYDFSYTGSYETTPSGVPESVINYLLYELAFYRAGFEWGHYYVSTSDAMHFTLTDNILLEHDGPEGLRKVFEYYD